MNLGKKIVQIRKDHKMSQEDFAEMFYVTRQTISSWENSKSYPDIETLIKISDTFHISLDILLKEDKKMIKKIDREVKGNKKLRVILASIILVLIILVSWISIKSYMEKEQAKKDDIRYREIVEKINELGFEKDIVGYNSITENGVTYRIYKKRPQVISEPNLSATTPWTEEEAIIADYNGTRVVVTYLNESNVSVYCNKDGSLKNERQNKNNIEIYHKYQNRTVEIVTRLTELYKEIYQS